jgi:Mg2+ and Co2+ transporter CorA
MRCFEINANGIITEIEVDRRSLSQQFDLHVRDLRPIFSLRQMPTIARRGKCLVINFRAVKIVVGQKEVLVFNTEGEKISDLFIPLLTERIISRDEKSQFEHVVLDAALGHMQEKTRDNFEKAERLVERILTMLRTQHHDEIFEKLLAAKKKLSKLAKNTRELNEMLDDILDDHEELEDMYLGKAPKTTDDLESILENEVEQLEDISNRIDELNENIDDTQEILVLKLSSRRNKIIQIDLVLTSGTAVLAFLAVVTGFFGMNIINKVEQRFDVFLWVLIGMCLFTFCSGIFLRRWMKKQKIL